jgi:fatty-acyl-CoA synthase
MSGSSSNALPGVPQCTLRQYEEEFKDRHLLHGAIAKWASEKPGALAFINHDRGQAVDWLTFEQTTTSLARRLLRMGLKKGDCLAAMLPFLTEHIFLEYACFKIGVIHAPLDLRLRPAEALRCLEQTRPKGFAFLGRTPTADFRELGRTVKQQCAWVEHLIQFSPLQEVIDGAVGFQQLATEGAAVAQAEYEKAAAAVQAEDAAQIIFTTGSTGSPKPALLSHRNISCQNLCLGTAFGFGEDTRLLVNLPPSHVGGQAEALMTTLFWGGTAIVLQIFDAARSLQAIQQHRVRLIGQIPAMFHYEWRLAGYSDYDLSSLEVAIYGGQQVPRPFLEKLAQTAPRIATGLGLTESAGFCTYTPAAGTVDDVSGSLGHDMPVYGMTIRQPMRSDGLAGDPLPDGEVGHICFHGPQTFLGYLGDAEATAQTISRDGLLYTGDLGFRDQRGLHLSGRAKWVIKPAGHQVFPADVENHFCALEDKVASCAAVGVEHPLLSEAIVAFVEKKPGADLTAQDLRRHAKGMASYMRPLHYILLEPGEMPMNRAAKSDYVRLRQMAQEAAGRLGWRRGV